MKIFLDTIGCRLNQAEIERYARQFRAAGHTLVARPEEADLAVVNTCAVTSAAESDSRQKIRQAARLGAKEVVVTGCWSALKPQEAARLPGVTRVVANHEKDSLVPDLLQIPPEAFDLEPFEREPIPGARLRTRLFIKVQDGCDNRCTFCITTVARGAGRSRPVADILADVRGALQSGDAAPGHEESSGWAAREIVLTGVHLGSWGQDFSPPQHLRDLVRAILDETGTPRLRLSSLEPWDLDEAFFGLWQDPRLCRHLHLPLQSGCARTLRRMARKTTPRSFASLVAAARAAIPGVAITTDVIAGFPGETEAEFAESLAFVEAMDFAGGHVFTFSARPGTAAARMPDQVPVGIRKERNARLRDVLAESSSAYQQAFIGKTLPVLWESASALGPQSWDLNGLTDNYLRVSASASRHLWNQITPVRLTGVTDSGMLGQIAMSDPAMWHRSP
jgi:threonylcarbamoyladenosine tRNA methylthiotransferase MtaB